MLIKTFFACFRQFYFLTQNDHFAKAIVILGQTVNVKFFFFVFLGFRFCSLQKMAIIVNLTLLRNDVQFTSFI